MEEFAGQANANEDGAKKGFFSGDPSHILCHPELALTSAMTPTCATSIGLTRTGMTPATASNKKSGRKISRCHERPQVLPPLTAKSK